MNTESEEHTQYSITHITINNQLQFLGLRHRHNFLL